MQKTDVLIVGQGLAGSTLAWRLAERGVLFCVVDRGGRSASRVAAGLMTPITGKRLTLAPDWAPMRRTAEAFYHDVEHQTGGKFFHARPSLRLFASPEEHDAFEQRRSNAEYAAEAVRLAPGELPPGLVAEHGGFWMPGAARLDASGFLNATQKWLAGREAFRCETLSLAEDFAWDASGVSLPRLGLRARRVVFCLGADEPPPPHGVGDQLVPAKGELLRIVAPELATPFVAHRGVWIAPEGGEPAGRYLVGATYGWHELDTQPTDAARAELLEGVAAMHRGPVKVIEQAAAIRPAGVDRHPIVEFSTNNPRVAWFNGLGAKGVLWAPWHAERLADQLAQAAA